MSTPIQIGRRYNEWRFLAMIGLAAGLFACGTALLIVNHRSALPVFISAGVAALVAGMLAVTIRRSRFQVTIASAGFLVGNGQSEREFHDDQVICASLSTRPNYMNGIVQSTTRTFDVWVEGEAGAEEFKMINRFKVGIGVSDPLSPLIDRVLNHLYERANASLETGQAFEGEGWTLHSTELVVNTKHNTRGVQFEALAAADVYDNHLCVWQHGVDEPVLRIPLSSANTQILQQLLQERITPKPADDENLASNQFGRILFERKPSKLMTALVWMLPILGLGSLFAAAIMALAHNDFTALAVGFLVFAVVLLIWALPLSQYVEFRVHEQGVRRKWLFRRQQLRYSEVDSFTYSAVRQYYKGMYTGTKFTLTFAALAGGQWNKLTYTKTLRNADNDLDSLRDKVSQIIADRMAAQFALGRAVVWTEGLRFLPEGLEYRAAGFFGRKAPIVIPYSQIMGYDANQGFFWMWVDGKKKPAVKESMALPNFFPGSLLLARVLAARASTTPMLAAAP